MSEPEKERDSRQIRREADQCTDVTRLREIVHEAAKLYDDWQCHATNLEIELDKLEAKDPVNQAQAQIAKAAKAREKLRAAALHQLAALMPRAIQQARQGKPALLRLILRSTR